MKFLTSALALGFVIGAGATAQAATCHGHKCHRVVVAHHIHHHYHHYYAGGYYAPPPGYPPPGYPPPGYPPPPPYGYSTFNQPLAPLGWTIGDEYWGNRSVFKLLMQSIGDKPYND